MRAGRGRRKAGRLWGGLSGGRRRWGAAGGILCGEPVEGDDLPVAVRGFRELDRDPDIGVGAAVHLEGGDAAQQDEERTGGRVPGFDRHAEAGPAADPGTGEGTTEPASAQYRGRDLNPGPRVDERGRLGVEQ